MTEKELRRLSKADYLRIIAELQEREEEHLQRIAALEAQLAERRTMLTEAGSIAEAALGLHGIFLHAQAAADQYLEEIRALRDRAKEETP